MVAIWDGYLAISEDSDYYCCLILSKPWYHVSVFAFIVGNTSSVTTFTFVVKESYSSVSKQSWAFPVLSCMA